MDKPGNEIGSSSSVGSSASLLLGPTRDNCLTAPVFNQLLIFLILPVAIVALQWAATRFIGWVGLAVLTTLACGALLWVAHVVIPDTVRSSKTAGTCFDCDLVYYFVPVLWGYAVFFLGTGAAVYLLHRKRST